MDKIEHEKEIHSFILQNYEMITEADNFAEYCKKEGNTDKEALALRMKIDCLERIIRWQTKLYQIHLEVISL